MKTSKGPVKNAKLSRREGGSLPPISPGSLTDPNEMEETEDLQDEEKVTGVKYISEDLIKRVTKQEDLHFIQNLNLCGSKSDKKIRYIENLERCEKLLVLNLSHNMIQKMEKMDRLHRLRELDLSHNRICKVEGLQHMGNLQQLNLSSNLIESVPLWFPKKLRSLTTLNLRDNCISTLHELCRLKSLVSLSQLVVSGNPVSALAHHRPLLIYHLRAVQLLDDQPVSQEDREEARERFHMEEVSRLEQELDQRGEEVEKLRGECEAAVAKFDQQVAQYDKLKQHSQEQQQQHRALQTELDTKTELLKQKSVNLTRACQKHYTLEQELAFLKIDAKFSPLPFYPSEDDDIEVDSGLNESPYIGRSRQHRKTASGDEPDTAAWRGAAGPRSPTLPSGGVEENGEERLRLLQMEIKRLEQQIHSANQELRGLEETANEKRMSEAEKEELRQRLLEKLEELRQDQAELQSLEAELQSHNAQMAQAHAQMDMLHQELQRMSPSEPQYAHLNAQLWRQQQLLDTMSARQQQLEDRLDYMLSRIAQETQDIKDLEQQLTDGQILANEALKRELEDVISGLQEYLGGVRSQAQQAQSECLRLQNHNQALQSLLQDQDEQLQQLQPMQMELDLLREENAELSEAVRESGLDQSDGDLEERSSDAQRLTAELNRLRSLSKVERAALEAELENERQARENAEVRMQLETENLLEHINSLKEESDVLREQAAGLQAKLQSSSDLLIHPEHLLHRLQQLSLDPTEDTPHASDMVALGNSAVEERLRELQQEAWRLLRAAKEEAEKQEQEGEEKEAQHLLQEQDNEEEWRRLQEERDEARAHQETLSKELQHLKHQLATMQKHSQLDRGDAAVKNHKHEMDLSRLREELQKEQEAELQRLREELSRAHEADLQQLKGKLEDRQRAELNGLRKRLQEAKEAELQGLREELQEAQEQQYLMSQRLQEAEGEKEGLLAELREKDIQAEELKRSLDGASGQQLSAVTQQLQALYKTAVQLRQQREQDSELLRRSRQQACELEGDLQKAEAETALLHTLLKDGQPVDSKAKAGPASSYQPEELENLARAVRRLTDQLNQASSDKSVSVEKLMDEMVALRDTLKQGSNTSSPKCSGHRNTQRYYIPTGHSAASLASQGTQDSGLGSQLPSSPPRKPRPQHRPRPHKNHPKGDGYWLYSLHPPNRVASDSAGESDPESGAPWWFFPAGALLYTSLPAQQPPPPPPSPHCNLPSHQRMERDLREAKRDLREQRGLERESKELQREIQQLRREHKRLRARVASGERSALEEVECLEETLRQRRAELREADRLLLHTHTQLKDKRAQSKEEEQRCREAQRRHKELQHDLQEMESRAQDYAKQLLHSRQHLSIEQEELQKLQHQRQNEDRAVTAADTHYKQLKQRLEENERLLLKAEDLLSQRNTELQSLNTELGALERRVGQWREEERLLQETLQQHRHTLLQELTQAEDEKHTLHTHIKELRVCEEDLSKQQRDVEDEVCEGRSLLKLMRQELQQEKQALDALTSELKRVQEEKQEQESQCEQLQEKCRHLEARQRHAQRCASNTEKALCEARADLAKLHTVLEESRDTAGLSTELKRQLEEEQLQLDAVRQAIQSACCERDGLLEERDRVRGEVGNCVERGERGHTRLQQLEKELKELDTQLSHKHTLLQQHTQTLAQQKQEWADEEAVQQQRRQQLQAQLQALEGAVAERVQCMEQLTAEEAQLQDRRRLLHTEEEQHRLKGQELCEWESRLGQQQRELEERRGEVEGWRSKLHKLQSHLKKQTHTLQHTQQAAKESEQRADTLQTELHTLHEELKSLREKEMKRCSMLESRPTDRRSVPKPKPEPEPESEPEQSALTVGDLQSPSPPHSPGSRPPSRGSSSGGEDGDQLRALLTPSRMSALAAQDEQRRGELLREKLEMHEDELKAQLRRRMFDQQEALCVRRQQTEGSLDDLRRRLDWLDQLLGDETALKTLKQHKVRLSSSWHSGGSSEPFYHPVKLERPLPQREMS